MSGIKSTELKYLQDFSLFTSKAMVLEVKESDYGKVVVLDATIFYPQGGGQPSDSGKIYNEHAVFEVRQVKLDSDGIVLHFGNFVSGNLNPNEEVTIEIDAVKRILHSKLHSAGHLIDCAIEKMAIPNLKPTKGFHFSEGPNVEYEGTVDNPENLLIALQEIIDELITQDLPLLSSDLTQEEAKSKGIFAPIGKKARIINFKGFSICGCGGTHVLSSRQIGKIVIKKIKCKNGITKISYQIL